MQRRRTATILTVLLALAGTAAAQEGVEEKSLLTPKARSAAEGALRWLADHQNPDGSWNARVGFKINDQYRLQPRTQTLDGLPHLGVTALAGMAFLSGGHLPGEGPYGDNVSRTLNYILSNVTKNGMITANGTRMYSHAFCLLFLAEIYGMTHRPDLREKLDRAVEFTFKAQNPKGGWRYAPLAQDSDMSITVCQVVALREARNIGIKVPKEHIDRALRYVMESAVTRGPDRGAFLYQHKEVPFNRNSFALTAAGLTTIQQAGLYSDSQVARFCAREGIKTVPSVRDCVRYLWQSYEHIWLEYRDHYFYFYGNYYAAQAMYTRGGADWRRWYAMVRDDLLHIARESRDAEGRPQTYWRSQYVGDAFSTSVAAVILQVPKHYLPIFQR